MENVGRKVAEAIVRKHDPVRGKPISVVCGSGNNGMAASSSRGISQRGVLCLRRPPLHDDTTRTEEARTNWKRLLVAGIRGTVAPDIRALEVGGCPIRDVDVVVDATLGTGVRGGVRQPIAAAIRIVNSPGAKKVSADMPSELDPESGGAAGSSVVRTDVTVALHWAKTGLRERDEHTGR